VVIKKLKLRRTRVLIMLSVYQDRNSSLHITLAALEEDLRFGDCLSCLITEWYMYILYFYMRICYLGTVAIFHTLMFTQVFLLKTPLFNTCVSKLTYSIDICHFCTHSLFATKFERPVFLGYDVLFVTSA